MRSYTSEDAGDSSLYAQETCQRNICGESAADEEIVVFESRRDPSSIKRHSPTETLETDSDQSEEVVETHQHEISVPINGVNSCITPATLSGSLPNGDIRDVSPDPESLKPLSAVGSSARLKEQLYVVFVLLFFAGSSLGAIFINKTCLTGYNFRYPLTLMMGQMVFAIAVLYVLHILDYKKIPPLQRNDIPMLALPAVLFICNVGVGLSALSRVNIPMFSAFRRLTLLFVMGAEYALLRKTYRPAIVNAVVAMAFGAFISAIDDVTFSRLGYSLVFLNNLFTALYLASIKKVMKEKSFQPLALLYYVALLGLPVVVALIVVTGEFSQVVSAFKQDLRLTTPAFGLSLILTASGAFAVNFSTSLCTHVTSPLSTSVAGQVKNVLQTVLGCFSWGFVPTFMNMLGLLVALGAQLVFAYLKYKENVDAKLEEQR